MNNVPDELIFYAFRYALGRRSYAVGTVSDYLIENWHNLLEATKATIIEEINEAIIKNEIGMEQDKQSWQRILLLETAFKEDRK